MAPPSKIKAGTKESVLYRAFIALPFIALIAFALNRMTAEAAFEEVEEIIRSGVIKWDGGSFPVRESFYGIKWLDDIWRPVTTIFAAWNLEIDPAVWWQILTFITDFGLLYSIMLIESTRKANSFTSARFPLIFGLAAQLRGIGVVGPIYFFLHYISSQAPNVGTSEKQLTNRAYTRTLFPAMILGYYAPHFLSMLHPSWAARHDWDWIWQMFPVWVALIQLVLTYSFKLAATQESRIGDHIQDLQIIRTTISLSIVLSAGVWIYTFIMSPFPLRMMFLPHFPSPGHGWVEIVGNFVQYDHLFCWGSALLWLGYLFRDLKKARMVQQSWVTLLVGAVVTTVVLGPGATVGLGWLWREDLLMRHTPEYAKE